MLTQSEFNNAARQLAEYFAQLRDGQQHDSSWPEVDTLIEEIREFADDEKHKSLIIYRIDGIGAPSNHAVIKYVATDDQIQGERDVLDRFRQAVTRWVIDTEEGQDALKYAYPDGLNIGDVVTHGDDLETLQIFLEAAGLQILDIQVNEPFVAEDWVYDTNLCDYGNQFVLQIVEPDGDDD